MKAIEAIKIIKMLIASVERVYKTNPLTDKEPHPETDALTIAISALEKQEEDRWIPVTDRLPEEYGEYRITWKTSSNPGKRFIGDAEYEPGFEWDDAHDRFKGEWLLEDYIKIYPNVEVIAWKPIGEPYTEEEHDKP